MSTEAELHRQNERLELLLNLTTKITSSLEIREVLRSIAANIREVIHADAVVVSLPDAASGKSRVIAVDFPRGKGAVKEEVTVTLSPANKKAIDTLKPVVICTREREELAPEAYDIAAAEGLKAVCLIPLVNRGRVLGTLSISRTTETPFVPEDVDFLSRASGQIAIALENALAYREISELKDKLAQEKLYLEEEFRNEMGFEQIIGSSAALKHVLQQVETVAPSDSTVLLLGETGTGKELIARAIHDRSRRKQRTLVKLNCAAIPTGLLESELFGHEKGAFTGAISQKIGRLELADQGTLFLDEVGDISLEIQPKLLRVLQEREFERLGSTHTLRANVRVVAATHRNLLEMVRHEEFREDLYYRLNIFPIHLLPLRERKSDIPELVRLFVERFSESINKTIDTIPKETMQSLVSYPWPGNIRELQNYVARGVVLAENRTFAPEPPKIVEAQFPIPQGTTLEDKTRAEVLKALQLSNWRIGGPRGAATRLGLKRTTLSYKMRRLGIAPPSTENSAHD